MDQVKALLFDVFGIVVDWRSSVISELEALGEKSGIALLKIINTCQRNQRLGKVRTRMVNGLYC
jgi:hypothetical protein